MINVYPNPTHDSLTIKISLKEEHTGVLTINNILGREVGMLLIEEDGPHIIPMKDYPDGVYFIRLNINGVMETEKVFIKTA